MEIKDKKDETKVSSAANPSPTAKEQTVDIQIDAKPEQEQESATINLKNPDFFKKYVNKKTVESTAPKEEETTTPKEEREKIIADEKAGLEESFTKDDFEFLSDAGIDVIDILMTTLLRWIAKDNSDAPYQLPVDKSNKLKKIFTKVLIRYSVKMPLWLAFVIGLCFAYITPTRKAIAKRKDTVEPEEKPKITKPVERVEKKIVVEDAQTGEPKETIVKSEVKTESKPPFVKRRPGRPNK